MDTIMTEMQRLQSKKIHNLSDLICQSAMKIICLLNKELLLDCVIESINSIA